MTDLETFFRAYVQCALWTSYDESESEAEHLDENYGPDDLAASALDSMRHDCADFIEGAGADLDAYCEQMGTWHGRADSFGRDSYTASECAGHDFWYSRNGHGVGFWDRGLGELGERLTAMSSGYGESVLYVGDDGLVYVS